MLNPAEAPFPASISTGLENGGDGGGNMISGGIIAIIVVSGLAFVAISVGIAYFCFLRQKALRAQQSHEISKHSEDVADRESNVPDVESPNLPELDTSSSEPIVFTYQELQLATKNFSPDNYVGQGGFGSVYKAFFSHGKMVAVKRMKVDDKWHDDEFRIEVEMLSRLHSPYLLHLIGYCEDEDHRLIVYEYMHNGSLQNHLYLDEISPERPVLSWDTRMKIALDAAKGLEYMHEFVSPPVIHRDFKTSNILLDENFNAKLSDFGLAKIGPETAFGHVSTRVLGTHGYVAPEYIMTGHLTAKSDVYSFGVVLLELLTGRVPVDMKRPPGEGVLVSWALPRLTDRSKIQELVDPTLEGQYTMKELIQVAAIAAMCVQSEADYRPFMIDVVQSLLPLVKQRAGGKRYASTTNNMSRTHPK